MNMASNEGQPPSSRQARSHHTVIHGDGNLRYWSVLQQRWFLTRSPENLPAWELAAMPPEEQA
jgi:hypothetical protein